MTLPQSVESRTYSTTPCMLSPILSADIIAQVCQQIFATPLHQYDLSLMRGHNSQWSSELRFRASLPLVSKTWWQPATRGLYKHVVIRRLGQISRLARTLSSKDAGIDFGVLVRKITLYHCIVVLPDWHVKSRTLEAVFKRCVALEEFSFHGHPNCEDSVTDGEGEDENWWERPFGPTNPTWIFPKIVFPALYVRAPTALRKLDLASLDLDVHVQKNMHVALHMLILASPRLASLSIQNYRAPIRKLPTLAFLEELHLDFRSDAPKPSSRAIWMWGLPRLRALTVVLNELPILALEKLGRTLTYLHLSSSSADTPCTGAGFAQLPQLCPALEHLVFYPQAHTADGICALLDSAEPLRNLRHLDVWRRGPTDTQAWTPSEAASLLERLRSRLAPTLSSARGLLAVTPLPHEADLPATICHPSTLPRAGVGEGGTRFVCVGDVWIVQTAWCVRPLGDWWLDEGMWLGRDPDCSDEGDRSNYGYESESEGWGSESESGDGGQGAPLDASA
ncbi:hypothetical protein V8D89_012810 [Ganoderma adspersum]